MKSVIDLSAGSWELVYHQPGELPDWVTAIPAQVPGGAVLDLHRAGLLPDPFYAENFRACRWTEEWVFCYRTRFSLPPSARGATCEIEFEGIDTFAEVFVNGLFLGRTRNMFRRHRFRLPVDLPRDAEHVLLVRIDPWLSATRAWMAEAGIDLAGKTAYFGVTERLAARKMQQAFGWDNTPRLLAGGIFRPVRLVARAGPSLGEHAWAVTDLDATARTARVEWSGHVQDSYSGLEVRLAAIHADGSQWAGSGKVSDDGTWSVTVEVTNARLWWPNGLGAPDLYNVHLQLLSRDGFELESERIAVGLRTVRVKTDPVERRQVQHRIGMAPKDDADGGALGPWTRVELPEPIDVDVRSFILELNGRPLFIKGCNWQTPSAIPGGETVHQIETLLDAAVAANLNLLRVWGGGLVESPAFFDGCTRRGLLVWQDFFFACGQFPREAAFLAEVEAEAEDIVLRLRNHTCIVAWCGDNESDMMDHDRGLDPALNPTNKRILPGVLARLDPQHRHYHPSSPSSPGIADHPRSDWSGDKRNWGAWHPRDNYAHIRTEEARIISEGGSYALPAKETVEAFMPAGLRWPLHNRTWRLHSGDLDSHARAFWKLNFDCWAHFGEPLDLDEAIALTQFAQAWGYKLLVERCRQRWPDCGGLVLWKFNDTWPCVDAGLFDYFLRPRLAFDFVAAACQPVAISMIQDPAAPRDFLQVWLSNDRDTPANGDLVLELILVDERGRSVSRRELLGAVGSVAANRAGLIGQVSLSTIVAGGAVFVATWTPADRTAPLQAEYTLEPRTAWRWHRARSETVGHITHAHD